MQRMPQRLFGKYMLARGKRLYYIVIVRVGRGGYHHGIQFWVGQRFVDKRVEAVEF